MLLCSMNTRIEMVHNRESASPSTVTDDLDGSIDETYSYSIYFLIIQHSVRYKTVPNKLILHAH